MAVRTTGRHAGDTKSRILDAAETLFIECGYEAMSLRQITSRAEVNLAAVNYHFGSKESLIHSMLSRRLDHLNQERHKLLDRFDTMLGERLTCEHVLGAMFIPALRLSREPRVGGKAFLRLLGRAYTDPSSFIRDFLNGHYASVAVRFFDAFQRALPHLPLHLGKIPRVEIPGHMQPRPLHIGVRDDAAFAPGIVPVPGRRVVHRHAQQRRQRSHRGGTRQDHAMPARSRRRLRAGLIDQRQHSGERRAVRVSRHLRQGYCHSFQIHSLSRADSPVPIPDPRRPISDH